MGYEERQNHKNLSRAEQFQYVKEGVNKAMKINGNFESFNKEIIDKGIEPIYQEGSEGVYNVKFRNCNASTPVVFDCTDIGLTFQDIRNEISDPKIQIETSIATNIYETQIYEKPNPEFDIKCLAI